VTVTEGLTDGGALVVIVGGVAAAIRWGVPAARAWRANRRALEKIWPIRPVAASYRGPGGVSVPAGEYRCPRESRQLELDYPKARGHCPACGRDYELQFPTTFNATWR
jgi:hypothetical protein